MSDDAKDWRVYLEEKGYGNEAKKIGLINNYGNNGRIKEADELLSQLGETLDELRDAFEDEDLDVDIGTDAFGDVSFSNHSDE